MNNFVTPPKRQVKVKLTDRQAKILGLKPYSQLSPLFEKNCLLLSGNESFQDSEKDIEALTK